MERGESPHIEAGFIRRCAVAGQAVRFRLFPGRQRKRGSAGGAVGRTSRLVRWPPSASAARSSPPPIKGCCVRSAPELSTASKNVGGSPVLPGRVESTSVPHGCRSTARPPTGSCPSCPRDYIQNRPTHCPGPQNRRWSRHTDKWLALWALPPWGLVQESRSGSGDFIHKPCLDGGNESEFTGRANCRSRSGLFSSVPTGQGQSRASLWIQLCFVAP